MHKLWLLLSLVLGMVLAACTGAGAAIPAGPTSTVTPTRTISSTITPTKTIDSLPTSEPAACTISSSTPTPGPTEASLFPAVSQTDWKKGSDGARVVLMVYSDFQCPYCARFAPILGQIAQAFPQDVQVVFRYFPLDIHDKSLLAAQAAEAAGMQGKFWEMHDVLFTEQDTWAAFSPDQFEPWVKEQAKTIGLDTERFIDDMESDVVVQKVTQARDDAQAIPVPGTPFLVINGRPYQGPRDFESLSSIISLTKLQDRQFLNCPDMTINPQKTYLATIKTEVGDILLQLFPDKAPMAVNSFVFLARQGWYDNTIFYTVVPGYIAQAGDPSGSGIGGPGYAFSNEITATSRFDKPGVVGMANAGPNSNGSRFFITYAAAPDLDGDYTVFGQVIQGMDVANKLNPRDPAKAGEGSLPTASKIISITIQEK
jgi:cyclophilin family peptidyl-prolyl cis-trans isomerase/protein-disulfide isomerase